MMKHNKLLVVAAGLFIFANASAHTDTSDSDESGKSFGMCFAEYIYDNYETARQACAPSGGSPKKLTCKDIETFHKCMAPKLFPPAREYCIKSLNLPSLHCKWDQGCVAPTAK